MDILKLYQAKWQQEVYNELENISYVKWINYNVLYRRENHIAHQQVNKIGNFVIGVKHIDSIDDEIFNRLNETLKSNTGIENFSSTCNEFTPWNEFEQIEKARASKIGFGYKYNDLQINTDITNIVKLETRIFFTDAKNVKNSVIYNLPITLDLNLIGNIPSLKRESFMNKEEAEKVIEEHWIDREDNYCR